MKNKFLMLFIALGAMNMQAEAQSLLKKMSQEVEKSPATQPTANSDDEVTLVVSADGITKDEATRTALRSAIEQTYGTFVSGNTTILNDELVKDEIVTVASGNIKNYKEIASNVMPDGKTFVTLQATVSISKLVSYAQSKGAETEFAGAAFAMNVKMKDLNKQNEMKVLQNLIVQVKKLLPISFDKKLVIKDPTVIDQDFIRYYKSYAKEIAYAKKIETATAKVSFDIKDPIGSIRKFKSLFTEISTARDKEIATANKWLESATESYLMEMNLHFTTNNNTKKLLDLVNSTLKSIALAKEEQEEYKKLNLKMYTLEISFYFPDEDYIGSYRYVLRNSVDDINAWKKQLIEAFWKEYDSYKIVDNTGQESYFDGVNMISKIYSTPVNTAINNDDGKVPIVKTRDMYMTEGLGLFSPYFFFFPEGLDKFQDFYWKIKFLLPKSDISKYTNFRIEPKQ